MNTSRQARIRSNIERLHRDYSRNNLSLLLGAGISVPSGFPSWDTLNQRLLLHLVEEEHQNNLLSAPLLPTLAKQLYELFGRDSAAEFVHMAAKPDFERMLTAALYEGRSLEELPLTSLQYQLATMSRNCRTTTLNFEPLLELACERLAKGSGGSASWMDFRTTPHIGRLPAPGQIEHLHGWLDPDGGASANLILTEKHYFDLSANANAAVNDSLERLLTGDGSVLTVGLSWADYNLRRMLYRLQKENCGTKIFTVLREDDVVLEEYAARRWEALNLIPIFVKEFDSIPPLLRDVTWGLPSEGEDPRWLKRSLHWRMKIISDEVMLSTEWQTIATDALRVLNRQLRVLFGVPHEERLHSGFFTIMDLDVQGVRLHQVASSRRARTSEEANALALRRALRLGRGCEQGAAGVTFVLGNNRQVLHGEPGIDAGFDRQLHEAWSSSENPRDWRSLLCVPILDSEDWLPVGVVTITSNLPQPFWTRFGSARELQGELYALLRKTGRWLLSEEEPAVSPEVR